MRRSYIQEKGFSVIELWECEWWTLYKTSANVKEHVQENFYYRCSQTDQKLLEEMKNGKSFGYVQCDIELPGELGANFDSFPPSS